MKKLIAILLVICTVAGLVACGKKPAENPNPSTPAGSTDVTPNADFKGKTLQIFGVGTEESYTDYDQFGKGNYLWMMKAAIVEWATINEVKIEWKGSYNQNVVLSAMNSGDKPDIIFQTGNFPAMSNAGVTSPFTAEERKMLADICGSDNYFKMMEYKGEAHGFVYPWSGVSMLYYNKTMFENYGVKTPKEYFEEGTWNWDAFQKCLEETTKDIDADGTIDTYGTVADSIGRGLCYSMKEDENGNLVSRIDDQIIYDFFEMCYDQFTVKKTIQSPGKNQIQKNVTYPMQAMQIGDCEPYNFEHLYQTISNGDVLEAVPVPVYDGAGGKEQNVVWTDSCGSLAATCDERAAALDLIAYLLKCGLKYISDFSLGAVPCEHAGMQGACDLSKQWKEAFAKVCADRAEAIKTIDGYDEAMVKKINEHIDACTPYTHRKYAGVEELIRYSEKTKMPAASAIPAVKAKYQASLDKYNSTYIK